MIRKLPLVTLVILAGLVAQEGWKYTGPPASTSISITTYRNVVPVNDIYNSGYLIHPKIRIVSGLCVYRNGLRLTPEVDYTYESATGLIVPNPENPRWSDSDHILVDFDVQQ